MGIFKAVTFITELHTRQAIVSTLHGGLITGDPGRQPLAAEPAPTGTGYCTGTGTGEFMQLKREKKKVVLYYYAAMTNGKCTINTSVGFVFEFSRDRVAYSLAHRSCA